MDNKIDLITATFEDKSLEKKYLDDKWIKVKSFYLKILYIFLIGGFSLLISLYIRDSFTINSTIVPLTFMFLSLAFIYKEENFRKKYVEKMLFYLPVIFVPLWIYLDFTRLSGLPHRVVLPLSCAILYINLFPFNFISSVMVATVPFLACSTLLYDFDSLNIPLLIMFFIIPHLLLILNKWRNERDLRLSFLKTKTIEEKSLLIDENRKLMNETLKRYFGDELSDKIISQKGELEGENRWVSILFNDISDYSTITENMAPEVALEFLNEYFSEMHKVIREFNGQILNYIGDSIMVVFGAPNKVKGHENKAIECAIKMREKLKELNQSWDENDTSRYWKNHGIDSIKMRIGVHTGSVIAGNVGSVDMIQYSTIGDTVNVAARLERANKEFGTNILFGDEVYTSLTKKLHSQSTLSGEITLKGRAKPTKVYSI
tara:strand:- start:6 stop:1298 length:1293 start_codon:yes stop_codon:yes gene_type:complete